MQEYFTKKITKKAVMITGITSATLFLGFPALAAVNSNSVSLNQDSTQVVAQAGVGNSNDINNVDTGDRNTSPEVNREQNRPGTGVDSDTNIPDYTNDNSTGTNINNYPNGRNSNTQNNRMMQNRTGSQNYPNGTNGTNGTNSNNNNNRMMQNRTGSQNYPNGTNNNNNNNRMMQNRGGSQSYPNGTNSNYNNNPNNSQMNNSGANNDNTGTGSIRGLW
ncbi:hypothetical protein [Gloeothece verrucosa]|uniref:Rab GTPase domain-containing protein n=1 Tax=Gloeothece verrucosa (strain PCC 7822) TaxID=497965 RepID=E0UKA6_GLOV7|nr:hypothetical protein [Gloeothece verrucosa]ADN15868.1 Rab GTPase domain-containing protein [Gloeothece verrucosa PCC 7822]